MKHDLTFDSSGGSIFRRMDWVLITLVTFCAGMSVVMLRTMWMQEITPEVDSNDWIVQLISLGIGMISCFAAAALDYHRLARFWFLYAPAALGIFALTFTSLAYGRAGADDVNWIDLGFVKLQPSEILKLAFLLTFSYHISRVADRLNQPMQLLLLGIHAAIPTGLVAVQGDYGTAIVFAAMTVLMLFAAGLSFWYMLGGAALLPIAVWFVWTYVFGDVHRGRIRVLFHPGDDPLGLEYQQNLSISALQAGGLFGLGLNGDTESYVTVPEMHNDFIFSFIAEAFGFVGAVTVIIVLVVICLRVFADSRRTKDTMGKTICMGAFAILFTHDLVNLGMVLKVMPVIGIPLPFFSAGGTAMVSMYLCIGLVISTYTHNQRKYRVFYDAETEK